MPRPVSVTENSSFVRVRGLAGDRDGALLRELHRVRREVEQHAADGDAVPDAHVGLWSGRVERDALLRGQRLHEIAHHLQHARERERHRPLVHEAVAAVRELDDVVRERREPERRAVDEIHLPRLDVHERPTPSASDLLGEQQDRVERRTHVVHDLDQQLHRVGTTEPAGELLRAVALELRLQPLDRTEHVHHLGGVPAAGVRRQFLEEEAAEQREELMCGGPDGRGRLRGAFVVHRALDAVASARRGGVVHRLRAPGTSTLCSPSARTARAPA